MIDPIRGRLAQLRHRDVELRRESPLNQDPAQVQKSTGTSARPPPGHARVRESDASADASGPRDAESESKAKEPEDRRAEDQEVEPGREKLSAEEKREVEQLQKRDAEVRRHEMAHATVGGAYTGSPTYEVERGPDGRAYAVAGHVPVDVSPVPGDPQATVQKMRQVVRAALAPADPSAEDRRVAAQAEATAREAQQQMQRSRSSAGPGRSPETAEGEEGQASPSTPPQTAQRDEPAASSSAAMITMAKLHAQRAYGARPTAPPPETPQ